MKLRNLSKICDSNFGGESKRKQAFKASMRSKVMDTETTEEVVEVVKEAIREGEDPVDALEAVVEILGEVIDGYEAIEDSRARKVKDDLYKTAKELSEDVTFREDVDENYESGAHWHDLFDKYDDYKSDFVMKAVDYYHKVSDSKSKKKK